MKWNESRCQFIDLNKETLLNSSKLNIVQANYYSYIIIHISILAINYSPKETFAKKIIQPNTKHQYNHENIKNTRFAPTTQMEKKKNIDVKIEFAFYCPRGSTKPASLLVH